MTRNVVSAVAVVAFLIPLSVAVAQTPTQLYDSGSLAFSYVQTPFPFYSGDFAATGEAVEPDGTLPPGVDEAVGGGAFLATSDSTQTAFYGVVQNDDGTYDAALVAVRTLGPLTAGNYPVNLDTGSAIFGFIDDLTSFDLPDTLDQEHLVAWLFGLTAEHKLVSISGNVLVTGATADTLYGSFSGTTIDIDNPLFLVNVDDGEFALSGTDVVLAALPPAAPTTALRAQPNPFNPRTELAFALPTGQSVKVAVYDPAGRRVRVLHDGSLAAGDHRIAWNGTDRQGQRAAAGVYLMRATGLGWQRTAKVTLAP